MSDSEQCSNRLQLDLMLILDNFFSSAVPSGSGAFQMPTRPSSAAASTLRGGGGGEGPISETLQ